MFSNFFDNSSSIMAYSYSVFLLGLALFLPSANAKQLNHPTLLPGKESRPLIALSGQYSHFYRLRIRPGELGAKLNRMKIRDNIEIPIDCIRFLADIRIREELGLPDSIEEQLQPLFDSLIQFERKDKWEFHSSVESVSLNSQQRVHDFIEKLNTKLPILSETQLNRLEQLRLRFNCLDTGTPLEKAKSLLNLSGSQSVSIGQIVNQELEGWLRLDLQLESLGRVLSDDQKGKVDAIFIPFLKLETPKGLLLAQSRELMQIEDVKKERASAFDLELIEGTVLTLSGRTAIRSSYLEADGFSPSRPWKQILNLILNNGMDWLEITESQRSELSNLKIAEPMEDGGRRITYFGSDHCSRIERPTMEWTKRKYSDWQKQFKRAWQEADENLGSKMKEILLPVQVDVIRTGLAAQRAMELGPYHLLKNSLAETLEISDDQKKMILDLRSKRLASLESVFLKIENRAKGELSEKQRKLFEEMFGEPCSLYPSIWVFLVK